MKINIAQPSIGNEEVNGVEKVMSSGMLAQGSVVHEFEEQFAQYCDVKYAIAVNNGTAALHAALVAAGIGPGDEVIVPSFSFIATATCVSMCGAKPVFVDVDEDFFTMDPEYVSDALSGKTRAIIGVHLYGQPFDLGAISEICEDHGLKLIEDAAQAHGARYHGTRVGSFGDSACFSFYATKNMTTGEGGMITTNDWSYAEKIRQFINHGQSRKYLHTSLGYNYRMTDICGAIGLAQLGKIDKFNEKRNRNAQLLNESIKVKGLKIPVLRNDCYHVYHQYVLTLTPEFSMKRADFIKYLEEKGIGSAVHYPIPIHKQPLYEKNDMKVQCPVSEQLSEKVLSLPVHPHVSPEQVEYICEAINEVA